MKPTSPSVLSGNASAIALDAVDLPKRRPRQAAAPTPRVGRAVRRTGSRWVTFAALVLICSGFVLPFIWMLSTSLKPLAETTAFPPRFVPQGVEFFQYDDRVPTPIPQNYVDVVTNDKFDFIRLTRNSLLIAGLAVIGTVASSSLVAYGFSRINFKGRGLLFAVMLATMMIPFPVLMVSLFSIFRWIGDHTPFEMLGTLRPLWIGAFFGNAFSIFLLRQFFMTIPQELSEAARIDGCGEFGIYWRIMLPLSKPALVVVGLFTFLGSWNDFLGPLIYLHRPDQYTLALGLQVFQSQHGGTSWNLLMAASLLVIAPVIVLYFLTQKTFVEGIATTGMKG